MRVSKIVFSVLFLIIGLSTCWIGGKFFVYLYNFLDLNKAQKIEVSQWEAEEVKPGQFALIAHFAFEMSGKKYSRRFQFPKPIYPNPYLAKDQIEGWKQSQWWVWYNAKNPAKFSLQKSFPLKQGIYFFICLFLLFYFLWLNFYVARIHSSDRPS